MSYTSYSFPTPPKVADLTKPTPKGYENVNLASNSGNLVRLLQQLQGMASRNSLDDAAINALNASERDVNALYDAQMKGWHENLGGSLVNQMAQNRKNLSDRGLGNLLPALGDMGTDREYNLVMGQLKDDWLQNGLNHMAGLSKQRAQVNSRAAGRVASMLGSLSGTASQLYGDRTNTEAFIPQYVMSAMTATRNS